MRTRETLARGYRFAESSEAQLYIFPLNQFPFLCKRRQNPRLGTYSEEQLEEEKWSGEWRKKIFEADLHVPFFDRVEKSDHDGAILNVFLCDGYMSAGKLCLKANWVLRTL